MTVATPSQIANTIYESISNTIIQSMQDAQSQALSSQDVSIYCNDNAVFSMADDVNRCIKGMYVDKKKDLKSITKLCQPLTRCSAYNISLKSSLNVTDLINQISSIQTNISNSASNNLNQTLNSINGGLSSLLSTKDQSTINNIVTDISNNTQNITQKVVDSVNQSQGLVLYNYQANNITLDNVATIITNSVQSIDSVQSAVSQLSNSIVQILSTTTTTLTKWVTMISTIFMIVIGIVFMILYMLKRNDTRDFISFIIPYVIFVIGVSIIISIHLLFKPPYIMTANNYETYPQMDTGKLIFWCSFYSILLLACEIIYYKIINKKLSSS